ncbi:MAG: hypothetical protein MK132_21610 [Lentisphaerales bacterium]|nr:hypothetical protein [Lentisphaerales bacterium]
MYKELAIKSPCSESWQNMRGSEKTRHCEKCRFNVYDFPQMTEAEISKVLEQGKVCGRLFVRPDGTCVTKDCQKKLKRKKYLKVIAWAALVPLAVLPFINFKDLEHSPLVQRLRDVSLIGSVINKVYPQKFVIMGEICPPPKGHNTTSSE